MWYALRRVVVRRESGSSMLHRMCRVVLQVKIFQTCKIGQCKVLSVGVLVLARFRGRNLQALSAHIYAGSEGHASKAEVGPQAHAYPPEAELMQVGGASAGRCPNCAAHVHVRDRSRCVSWLHCPAHHASQRVPIGIRSETEVAERRERSQPVDRPLPAAHSSCP
jgi:hypothetical protein